MYNIATFIDKTSSQQVKILQHVKHILMDLIVSFGIYYLSEQQQETKKLQECNLKTNHFGLVSTVHTYHNPHVSNNSLVD